ncbi:MAG TPA: endospore germination permease [Firmicutes bacterium]|nr:endospore germination permease [Bacillota bacterium]
MREVEGGKISGRQLAAVLVLIRAAAISMTFPTAAAVKPPQDIWVTTLLGTLVSVIFVLLVARLGLRAPDKTIIEQAELLLGRCLGKLAGMILVWYWMLVASCSARELGESYTTAIMPETPVLVFMVATVFLAANAARNGLEVVGRMGESILWVVLFFAALVLVLPYDQMRFKNLAPVLARGFRPLMLPTGTVVSFFLEFIILGMIIPCLARPRDAARYSVHAVLVSGALMTWLAVALVAVFGPALPDLAMPAFSLSRMISIANFFERIEALIMAAWTLTSAIKVALFLWGCAVGLAQVFGISRYQSFVYPLGAMTVALGMLSFESDPALRRFLRFEVFGVYSLITTVGTMAVLYLAAFLRTKPPLGRGLER